MRISVLTLNKAGKLFISQLMENTVCLNVIVLPSSGVSSSAVGSTGSGRQEALPWSIRSFYKDILFLLKISAPAYSEELVKLADWVENDKLERHFHVFVAKRSSNILLQEYRKSFFHKLPVCVAEIRFGAGNACLLLPPQSNQQHPERYS